MDYTVSLWFVRSLTCNRCLVLTVTWHGVGSVQQMKTIWAIPASLILLWVASQEWKTLRTWNRRDQGGLLWWHCSQACTYLLLALHCYCSQCLSLVRWHVDSQLLDSIFLSRILLRNEGALGEAKGCKTLVVRWMNSVVLTLTFDPYVGLFFDVKSVTVGWIQVGAILASVISLSLLFSCRVNVKHGELQCMLFWLILSL